MSERIESPLWHGKGCCIPTDVAVCPECGGQLAAWPQAWDFVTGRPSVPDIEIECLSEEENGHSWRQCDWQLERDKIAAWCGALD